jgi:putative Mn2+ efflux pump MntP
MSFGSILLLAVGLSMDAMAVAAARGVSVRQIRVRHVALVAGFFGGFQALMPLLGYLLGSRAGPAIEAWDHWVVFAVLGGIGAKMLWEALSHDGAEPAASEADAFRLRVLLVLAIATSIDALAAGFALPLLGAPLLLSIAVIGITTAILSGLGLFAGHRFGAALGRRLDIVGGLLLIGLGAKTLIEHLG